MRTKIAAFLAAVTIYFGLYPSIASATAIELFSTSLFTDGNLQNYYRMEGNSNDSKGSANGTDTSVSYSSTGGQFGQYASFNGTSSKIESTIASNLSGSFTINLWVYRTGSFFTGLIESHVASYNNYWIYITDTGGNKIRASLYDGSQNPFIDSTNTVSQNAWHMITFVRNTGTGKLQLYVDGSSAATDVSDPTTAPTYSAFDIGSRTNGEELFTGRIDDVDIFNRVLTSTEVSQLYNGTLPSGSTATPPPLFIFD